MIMLRDLLVSFRKGASRYEHIARVMLMRGCQLGSRCWYGWAFLMLFVVEIAAAQVKEPLLGDLSGTDNDLLRFRPAQWINLSVDVEEHVMGTASPLSGLTMGSLAVLPSLVVQWPDPRFRPYINAGLGLRIGGFTSDSTSIPLTLRFEERLTMQIGGGIAYDLGKGFSLIGSTSFSREKTTDLLSYVAQPSFPLVQDDLDVNAYTVELGFRLVY